MFTLKNSKIQAVIVLIMVFLGAFIASYAQNQLAGMSVQFMEFYGFTEEQYAEIYSASSLLSMFFAFVVGLLSDKVGTRKIILIAAAVVTVAAICRVFAFSFEAQYISNMMCGFTGLFMAVNRAKILGGWFPATRIPLVIGIATTSTPVANTIGVGLTSMMPSIQFALGTTAAISIVLLVLWTLFGKESSEEIAAMEAERNAEGSGNTLKNLVEIVKTPWIWVLCLAATACMAAQVPLMAFTTVILQTIREMEAVAAGGMATAITIGMGVGSVVTPIIVRKIGAFRPVIIIYTVLTALVLYFAWQMPIGAIMYAVYFVGGFTLGYLLAMIFTFPVMIYGREKAATAGGIVQTFVLFGASVMLNNVTIPLAGGASPETFPTIMLIAAVYSIIGGICLFIIPDQQKRAAAAEKAAKEAAAE